MLRECLSGYTSEECVALLGRNQIVAGAVRRYREVLASPDMAASGILVDAVAPGGERYRALSLPYRLGEGPRPAPSAAPACGADGHAVLAEAGYSDAEISALREQRIVL